MIVVRFFAKLKEMARREEIQIQTQGPLALHQLIHHITAACPMMDPLLREKQLLLVVNHVLATEDTMIKDGDEVALMPPFSGGEAGAQPMALGPNDPSWVRIQKEDFSIDEEIARLKQVSGRVGGIQIFLGTARDFSRGQRVDQLVYEHYEGMAQSRLEEIRARAKSQFKIIELSMIHRTGDISPGENIVLIVVAAEHRSEAFQACRWCIDELKQTVPIWKKEVTQGGEAWVEGRP